MTTRHFEAVVFGLILLSRVDAAGAQVITGGLLGTVRDETGAVLPGTSVRIVSPALLGGSATCVTNEKGQYRFPALAPGLYTLTVELSGFRTLVEEGLRVQVGATLLRNVSLELSAIAQSVTVTGESGLLDTKDSGRSSRYGSEYLENTPVRRFSMFDLINSAPGMSATRPAARANIASTRVSAFGSGANENTYLVDGTDFTGAYGGRAVPWIDTDVIEEIQIVGVGASAEYGNLQGAVFNVVSRQGGNDFRFDASYYGQFRDLTSQPIRLDCDCPEGESGFVRDRYRDFTTHLAGPVVKDRLWFFGGYQYQRDYESQPGADSRFPREFDADRIFWKINWQITSSLKLMHSYHDDYWLESSPYSVAFPYETGTAYSGHNPSLTFVNLTHVVSDTTFWDARVSGYYFSGKGVPNSGYTLPFHYDLATGIASGGSQFFWSGKESRTVAQGKLSHYATDFLSADHDFKFGVQFVGAEDQELWGLPGGAAYYDYYGGSYLAYFREPYTYGGQTRSLGAFVEDVVSVSERLTLNLGLRYDHSRAVSQDISEFNEVGEETGEVIEGLGTFYTWNVVSPRLGFNLKLTGDGRTLLRGNGGRYYQGVFVSEPAAVHPGLTPTTVAFFDPATGGFTDIAAVLNPTAQLLIDPETKAPYTDQFSIGLDREFFSNVAVGATYVYKRGRDFIGWRDVEGVYEPGTAVLSNGQTIPVFSLVSPPAERLFLLTNPEELFFRYKGLLLTFEKRWSDRWQALVSYSISEAVGLQASNSRPAGSTQLSSTLGTLPFGRDPNDYTNAAGNLNNDRTHMFRVQGAVEIPRVGVLVGANFQHLTGQPWAAFANVRLPQGSRRVFIEPRGTRRLSSQTLLDLRVSKIFRFGREGKLEVLADILNALNDTAEVGLLSDNFFSPNFEKGQSFVFPLRAMVGVKLSF